MTSHRVKSAFIGLHRSDLGYEPCTLVGIDALSIHPLCAYTLRLAGVCGLGTAFGLDYIYAPDSERKVCVLLSHFLNIVYNNFIKKSKFICQ